MRVCVQNRVIFFFFKLVKSQGAASQNSPIYSLSVYYLSSQKKKSEEKKKKIKSLFELRMPESQSLKFKTLKFVLRIIGQVFSLSW